MQFQIEYTDTFGGEANYSWCHRAVIEAPEDISDRALMRRAKAEIGLSGVRGESYAHGDSLEFRPSGRCTVMFVNPILF